MFSRNLASLLTLWVQKKAQKCISKLIIGIQPLLHLWSDRRGSSKKLFSNCRIKKKKSEFRGFFSLMAYWSGQSESPPPTIYSNFDREIDSKKVCKRLSANKCLVANCLPKIKSAQIKWQRATTSCSLLFVTIKKLNTKSNGH